MRRKYQALASNEKLTQTGKGSAKKGRERIRVLFFLYAKNKKIYRKT